MPKQPSQVSDANTDRVFRLSYVLCRSLKDLVLHGYACLPVLAVWCALSLGLAAWEPFSWPNTVFSLPRGFGLQWVLGWLMLRYLTIFLHVAEYHGLYRYGASAYLLMRRFCRLSWMSLLVGVYALVGFVCFVLPCFWVLTRFYFVDITALLAIGGGWRGLKQAYRITQGHWWVIWFFALLPLLLCMGLSAWLWAFFPKALSYGVLQVFFLAMMMVWYVTLRLRMFEELVWVHGESIGAASYHMPLHTQAVKEQLQAGWQLCCCRGQRSWRAFKGYLAELSSLR